MTHKHIVPIALLTLLTLASACEESTDERFAREAREATQKDCPVEIDRYTTLDSICYDQTHKEYSYHFTVKNELDLDSLYTDDVIKDLRETYLKDIKNSLQMKDLKDAGVTIMHVYRSQQSGDTLMEFRFTREDYAF